MFPCAPPELGVVPVNESANRRWAERLRRSAHHHYEDMRRFTTLYKVSKRGAMIQWRVWADGDEVITEWRQFPDGEMQRARFVCTAKNPGRANATTPSEQAVIEAQAKWTYRRNRGYWPYRSQATEYRSALKPMLAQTFKPEKHDAAEYFTQPKLDGIRCLAFHAEDGVRLQSRAGLAIDTMDHIVHALERVMPVGSVFDGELYCHGVEFQTISSWVRRKQKNSKRVLFWIYDGWPAERGAWPFEKRTAWLRKLRAEITAAPGLCLVRTALTASADIASTLRTWRDAGYEGVMLRTMEGPYEPGRRSAHLLKLKEFDDAEFIVTGAKTGKGREAACVIWKCKTREGNHFWVRPEGTIEDREKRWRKRDRYIGKKLTVRFLGYSNDGIPQKPVGVGFRWKGDL